MNLVDQCSQLAQWVCDQIYFLKPQPMPSREQLLNTKIVAHRGAHLETTFIENTIAAFQCCVDHKVWGIEFDIRWTRDNVAVICHDPNTKRCMPGPNLNIADHDFQNLRQLHPDIPRLDEVVDRFKHDLHFMIELKTTPSNQQLHELKRLLSPRSPILDFHLLSLEPKILLSLDGFPPECLLPVAELNVDKLKKLAIKHRWAGLSGHYVLLNQKRLAELHGQGQKIGTGFIHSKNCLYREVTRGVDWIFTNHPITMAKLTTENKTSS